MAHKVLVEVDEGQEVAHLRRVEEPFVFVEDHIRHGIDGVLAEDAVTRVLLRVGDVGWVDDDGVDEGDGGEALVLRRIVPGSIEEDEPSVSPSRCLAVDVAGKAVDDLLGTAVDGEDKLVEELIGLHEAHVLHAIALTLVVDDSDALHTAPVVIQQLDDLEEEVTVTEEGGVLIVDFEDFLDATDAQEADNLHETAYEFVLVLEALDEGLVDDRIIFAKIGDEGFDDTAIGVARQDLAAVVAILRGKVDDGSTTVEGEFLQHNSLS